VVYFNRPARFIVEADTWTIDHSSRTWLGNAGIVVDSPASTMTLIGNIPGISAASRLFFETCDYFAGCDYME